MSGYVTFIADGSGGSAINAIQAVDLTGASPSANGCLAWLTSGGAVNFTHMSVATNGYFAGELSALSSQVAEDIKSISGADAKALEITKNGVSGLIVRCSGDVAIRYIFHPPATLVKVGEETEVKKVAGGKTYKGGGGGFLSKEGSIQLLDGNILTVFDSPAGPVEVVLDTSTAELSIDGISIKKVPNAVIKDRSGVWISDDGKNFEKLGDGRTLSGDWYGYISRAAYIRAALISKSSSKSDCGLSGTPYLEWLKTKAACSESGWCGIGKTGYVVESAPTYFAESDIVPPQNFSRSSSSADGFVVSGNSVLFTDGTTATVTNLSGTDMYDAVSSGQMVDKVSIRGSHVEAIPCNFLGAMICMSGNPER
jgi:hypothetical protein